MTCSLSTKSPFEMRGCLLLWMSFLRSLRATLCSHLSTITQGMINSCLTKDLGTLQHSKQIPKHARPFLDDVGLHGPKSRYNDIEISPGIRKFVWEHAQIFRQFMQDVWTSGMTISGRKSAIAMPGITIVGMVCDFNGRHP